MFSVTIINKLPSASSIIKQMNYGTAVGLTKTAKDAQAEVIKAIEGKFIKRTPWYQPSSPIGIRITPATPQNQVAEIKTNANFLKLQDLGGTKIPFGKYIAVPTRNARPNPSGRIPAAFMPKALVATGKAFIETFKNGTKALSVHGLRARGHYSDVVVMYILTPRAKIKKADVWLAPIERTVKAKLRTNINREIALAFANMR